MNIKKINHETENEEVWTWEDSMSLFFPDAETEEDYEYELDTIWND